MEFKNWSGNQVCEVSSVEYPETVAQIQNTIKQCCDSRQTIRVAGSGHSFSPLLMGADCIISLQQYPNEFRISDDRAFSMAGATLHQYAAELAANGRSLAVMGDVDTPTLAGALSTGTHGPSLHHSILAESVCYMKLVDGKGAIREFHEGDPMLDAVRVSLGLLGVIIEVGFKTVPMRYLSLHLKKISDKDYLDQFEADMNRYEFHRLDWFSGTDIFLLNYGDSSAERIDFGLAEEPAFELNFVETAHKLYTKAYHDGSTENINAYLVDTFFADNVLSGPLNKALIYDLQFPVINSEFFVPAKSAAALFSELMKIDFAQPVMLTMRGVKADSNWLSMGYHMDSVAIACSAFCTQREIPKAFKQFNDFMHKHGARPHWGKWCQQERANLPGCFPKLEDFMCLRKEFDPHDVFLCGPTADYFV